MATISERRAILEDKQKRELQTLEREGQILDLLPPSLPIPLLSNISVKRGNTAWVSFREPSYGETGPSGAEILTALEAHGLTYCPLALFKPRSWRAGAWPKATGYPYGAPSSATDIGRSSYEIVDEHDLAPLYVRSEQYTGAKAIAFYQAGDWQLQVCVPVKGAMVGARRVETRGDWHYERGSARVHFPQHWHALGNAAATIHSAKGYVDTEKGLSGVIYWTPTGSGDMSPAEMLREMESQP